MITGKFERRIDFAIKWKLALLIGLVYLLCSSGFPWIEAGLQLRIAESLLKDRSFGLKGYMPYPFFYRAGLFYDPHGITNVIYFIPLVLLKNFIVGIISPPLDNLDLFLCSLWGIPVAVFGSLVFFALLRQLGISLRVAVLTTLCLSFATIVFAYGVNSYEGNLNKLFLLSSIYFIYLFSKKNKIRYVSYAGIFAGLMLNSRIELSAVFVFCLVLFLGYESWVRRNFMIILTFLMCLFPFVLLWAWYNAVRTGFWYLTPLMAVFSLPEQKIYWFQNIVNGLRGLLFSAGTSIFVFSPIVAVSFLGWIEFLRRQKKMAILFLFIIISFLLANAAIPTGFFGLSCWGPRYTLEITPLMMVPLAFWLSKDSS